MPRASKPKKIRVLLADDHPVVREGIRSCLSTDDRLEIVGEAVNGKDATEKAATLQPDIILMDINMPQMTGIEATRALVTSRNPARIVMLTVVNSQEYVSEMMRSGAKGYVLKDAHPDELISAVIDVHAGSLYFRVNETATTSPIPTIPPKELKGILSEREIQVLRMVAEGMTSKDIARETDLSVRTVKTYRERIMRKAGIHSVAEMVKYSIQTGLIPSSNAARDPESIPQKSKKPPRRTKVT
ncbi:MAG: response regulator transcription factor [Verrucomicrobiae bacterium]|nr:response regulator transcription factor [Verrucomicrobiae bacterium]